MQVRGARRRAVMVVGFAALLGAGFLVARNTTTSDSNRSGSPKGASPQSNAVTITTTSTIEPPTITAPAITAHADQGSSSTSPVPAALHGIAVVSVDAGVVTFTDADGLATSSVQLQPPTDGIAQVLMHYSPGVAYIAEGRYLYIVRPDAAITVEQVGPFSTIGPVSDDGFWSSVTTDDIDRVDWSYHDFEGHVGPAVSLSLSDYPFGDLDGELAVWVRERSQIVLATSGTPVVIAEDVGVPLTFGNGTVITLTGGTVIEHLKSGSSRTLFELGPLVPASTLEATALSPHEDRLAILTKDPQTYDVVALIVVDLMDGTRTDFPLDDGTVVEWLNAHRLLISGTLSAPYIFDLGDSSKTPLVSVVGQVLAGQTR